jgi:hypothetical protein
VGDGEEVGATAAVPVDDDAEAIRRRSASSLFSPATMTALSESQGARESQALFAAKQRKVRRGRGRTLVDCRPILILHRSSLSDGVVQDGSEHPDRALVLLLERSGLIAERFVDGCCARLWERGA